MAPDWMTANNAVSIAPPEPPYTDSPWDRIRRGIGTVLMHRAGPAAGILGALLAAPRTPSDVYQEGQQRWQDAYRRRLGEAQLGNFKGMQESRNLQDKARLLGLQGSLPLGTSPDDAQKALGVEPMTTEARGGTFVAQPQGYLNADTGRISGGFRNIFTPSGETTKMLMRPQPTESEELKRAYWTSRMQPKPAEQETPLQKAQRERTEAQTEAIRGGKPAKPISEWTQEQETELQSDKTPEQRKNILREFKTYLVGKHHGGTGQPKMTLKDRIGALTAEIQEKENNIEKKKAQPNAQEYVNQLKQIRSALIMEGATGNLNAKPITAPMTAPTLSGEGWTLTPRQ